MHLRNSEICVGETAAKDRFTQISAWKRALFLLSEACGCREFPVFTAVLLYMKEMTNNRLFGKIKSYDQKRDYFYKRLNVTAF
jgi:hypothetical protein